MRKRRDIEFEARKLLENNSVSRPPVPVQDLAAALDIDVRFSAGKDDVSGALEGAMHRPEVRVERTWYY